MKHKILANLKMTLVLSLFMVSLQLITTFQETASARPVQASNGEPVDSIITPTAALATIEIKPVITVTASIYPLEVITDSVFKMVDPAGVLSDTVFLVKELPSIDFGGGAYEPAEVLEITDQQRQEIQRDIDKNIKRLGLQKPRDLTPFNTALSWPVQAASSLTDYGYHGISNFVDHNTAFPNQLLDYNCGNRTYDLSSGYNHSGTDIFTWPFGWNKMDHDEVQVIAAAPGTIVSKQDGNFDRSCGFNNNPWNAVYIQHADGSVAWYGHLKKNSATSKPVGATVTSGEYLGIVGSSGSSTGPHLHFELHSGSLLIDPYAGACNAINSWWAAQRPYYDSAVNHLTTGSAPAVFPTCPNPELSNLKDQFNRGDTIYFTTYYRDQRLGQPSRYTIYKPDGSIYQSWLHSISVNHYAASYWYWSLPLGPNVPLGRWKFEVIFNGQTYAHNFNVGYTVYLPAVLKVN